MESLDFVFTASGAAVRRRGAAEADSAASARIETPLNKPADELIGFWSKRMENAMRLKTTTNRRLDKTRLHSSPREVDL